MASVNPYVLQGNIGLDLQRKMEDTMANIQMLGIQEERRREDAFVKMMDVATVNFVKDKAQEKQLKDLDTYNQEAAKIAIASNYNPTPQERLKLNNLKRDFLQSQQSLLASQQAWAKDREALALDKGQRFDTDMGMETVNEWDGISPYTQGQALTLRPKRRIQDSITDVLNKSFPYNKSASTYRRDKKADGSYTQVTEHSRVGLHKNDPNGRPVVDEEAKLKLYSMLGDDDELQYTTSYLLAKDTRAKAEEIMLTKKVPKAKAIEMAQEEMMKKWNASSVDDIKNQYLQYYTEQLLPPQITDEQKVQGKGSTFNLFGAGGAGGYEFSFSKAGETMEDGKSVTSPTIGVRKGNAKTTVSATELGIPNYKGNVPFEVTSMTPDKITGKAFKSFDPDMESKGYDNEAAAARNYKSGYVKGPDGLFHSLVQGAEVVYTVPATKAKIELLGDAFVKVYKEKFAGVKGNVFESGNRKSSKAKTSGSSSALDKWSKYTR